MATASARTARDEHPQSRGTRVTTISLSKTWMGQVGAQTVARWVSVVSEVARAAEERSPDDTLLHLERELAAAQLTGYRVVLERVAEMLSARDRGVLVIAASDGTVLHGPPELGPTRRRMTGPATAEDPEDPRRPTYS